MDDPQRSTFTVYFNNEMVCARVALLGCTFSFIDGIFALLGPQLALSDF